MPRMIDADALIQALEKMASYHKFETDIALNNGLSDIAVCHESASETIFAIISGLQESIVESSDES